MKHEDSLSYLNDEQQSSVEKEQARRVGYLLRHPLIGFFDQKAWKCNPFFVKERQSIVYPA